jgi:hypothetical protein
MFQANDVSLLLPNFYYLTPALNNSMTFDTQPQARTTTTCAQSIIRRRRWTVDSVWHRLPRLHRRAARIVVATIAMTMAGGRDDVAEDENAGWRRIDGAIFAACHIAI